MSEHEHPHTAADGSEIRHEDMLTVGVHRAHYHEGDDLVYVRPNGTSVHYPDIDGQPDPRSREAAEALLDECLGLLGTMPTPSSTSEQQYEWAERYRAFRDRPEVKRRLGGEGGDTMTELERMEAIGSAMSESSRSVQRRIAVQKGEPAPTFDNVIVPREQAERTLRVLEAAEFGKLEQDDYGRCRTCCQEWIHAPDCALAASIADLRAVLG